MVVALIAILTAIYIPNYLDQARRREFDVTVEKIVTALNQARDHSVSWDKSVAWGVAFGGRFFPGLCNNSLSNKHFFAVVFDGPVCSGSFYCYPLSTHKDELGFFSLPSSVVFDATSTWGWIVDPYCYSIITFEPITGRLANLESGRSTSSLKVMVANDPSVSSTISVSPLGFVTYTTSSDY